MTKCHCWYDTVQNWIVVKYDMAHLDLWHSTLSSVDGHWEGLLDLLRNTVFLHRTLWYIKVPYNWLPFVELTDCQSVRCKLSLWGVWRLQFSGMWCHVHILVYSYQHFRGLCVSILRCFCTNMKAESSLKMLLTIRLCSYMLGDLLQCGVWQSIR
jgi:hypothetical protein